VLRTGKAGFRAHLSLVVDGAAWRRPLGIIAAQTHHRSTRRKKQTKKQRSGSATRKVEDKEYARWWRGIRTASDRLKGCESVVHIADREGDSYELLEQMLAAEQRFVVRVRLNRRGRETGDSTWSKVFEVAANATGMFEREVPLSRRKAKGAPQMNKAHPPRKMRTAKLSFAATRVEIPKPYINRNVVPALTLNLVHVTESTPPPDEPAVEWLLYTTEPVDTPEQIAAVVDGYRTRWLIVVGGMATGCTPRGTVGRAPWLRTAEGESYQTPQGGGRGV